ncbi:MAG: flagellin [Succinivibrio sp.]|nr:flagellin [Succinivibrio sp.]
MGLYVQSNVTSLNSQRSLANATNSLDRVYQRLSSGLRINSARDDAAGLQISDRLTSQINGLYQGNRNCNDGIALAQIMEGALDETTSMLQRIRTLAVQASNGTNTDIDRQSIQSEIDQLCAEMNRIACRTTYAGQQVLGGAERGILDANGKVTFHVGAYHNDTIDIDMRDGFTLSGIVCISHHNIPLSGTAGTIDYQVHTIQSQRSATTGSDFKNMIKTGTFKFSYSNIPGSSISDVIGGGTSSISVPFTVANQQASLRCNTDQHGTIPGIDCGLAWNDELDQMTFSVADRYCAEGTIAAIDAIINNVDTKRAELGAIQNRMESTIRNQSNVHENVTDARSRIRDTDFAEESSNLTAKNIVQQAASSILTQANAKPQIALSLLNGG